MCPDGDEQEPGDRLRAMREAAGLTQAEAAQRLGVDVGTLSRKERGKGVSRVDLLAAESAYRLGVPRDTPSGGAGADRALSEGGPAAAARKAAESTIEHWIGYQAATARLLKSAAAVQDASSAMLRQASDMLAEAIAAHAAITANTLPLPVAAAVASEDDDGRAKRGAEFLREMEERRALAEAKAREEEEQRRRDAG